jgi:hypothetical protein
MLQCKILRHLSTALALSGLLGSAALASDFTERFQGELYGGRTGAAADLAAAEIERNPSDDTAQFALGVARFLGGVEGLIQSFHRYGLYNGADGSGILGLAGLPFLRLPVPENPAPDPVSYEALRAVLRAFGDDLAGAEAVLAKAGTRPVELPLDLARIRLDLDGDGEASESEHLLTIFKAVAGRVRPGPGPEPFLVDFDASDAAWLQAYTHLLMAMIDFPLAHDWEEAYAASFHGLFPDSFTPSTPLSSLTRDLQAKLAAWQLERPQHPNCSTLSSADCKSAQAQFFKALQEYRKSEPDPIRKSLEYGSIADLIAFVHLNHWPVTEPDRMASALGHLESMVELSRRNWRRILAETDDAREWIPGPAQTGVLAGMEIDQTRVDGWLAFLDEFEMALKGEKLLPHWRFAQGFNLRRMFLEPRTFDIVLMAQGSAIVPYLEDGPIADGATWLPIIGIFGGDFFSYFIWIN